MIIGLTGGSGAGKSTAAEFFKTKGFVILDLDVISRNVCEPGTQCLDEIASSFGNRVIGTDGCLMRRELGKIVFADPQKLKLLNDITHKYIMVETRNLLDRNHGKNIVIDAPLLFESGLDAECDVTLGILSGKSRRINRIMTRDGISQADAENRIGSQPDDEFYISACTKVIYNNSDTDAMVAQLKNFIGGYDV